MEGESPEPIGLVETSDGLEVESGPLMVLPVGTQQVQQPDGSTVEYVVFQVVDPATKTAMTTTDYAGEVVPVYIPSVPVLVKLASTVVISRGPVGRT